MDRLGDRFLLGRRIGSGGMSEVFLGTDEVLDRPVAIKVLRSGYVGSDIGARFSREGRTAARLSHPNVVSVYDAGEDVLDGREVSYIVMEHVTGGDLKGMMDERGRLSEGELARIGAEVVDGLAHAHERGIIHRDIKPHNVLIDDYGRPKLSDFGIAKALDSSTTTSQAGHFFGTALYSSPEQLRGEPATPKSDVYALGATLYHAAVGEPIFEGAPIEVASQQVSDLPVPPRERGAEIGARMDDLIMRCLAKDPAERPTTSELRAELLQISGDAGERRQRVRGGAPPAAENARAGVAGGGEAGSSAAHVVDRMRTVIVPTRTFRPGHDRGRNLLLVMAIPALILVGVLVWGVSSLFSFGDTTSEANNSGGQRESGGTANEGDSSGDDPQPPPEETAAEETTAPPPEATESAAPPADPTEAENAVFEMYVAAAENRFEDSYGYLSESYREEVGPVSAWEDRFSDVSYLTFLAGPSGRTSDGRTEVSFTTEESRSDGSRTVEGVWVVVEEDGEPRLDRLVTGRE